MDFSDPLIYAPVGAAAVIVGITAARIFHRPDRYWLQRGICPSCKSRKSLRIDPLNENNVLAKCPCGGMWIIHAPDGQPILKQPAPPPLVTKTLTYLYDRTDHAMIFSSEHGTIHFAAIDLPRDAIRISAARDLQPRQLLAKLCQAGAKPCFERYVTEGMSYKAFVVSATGTTEEEGPKT